MEVFTESAQETQKLGEKLANNLISNKFNGAVVVCLYGDLGSGKTTFVQGLAKALGVKQRILSPTFILMRQYKLISNLYHVDLYRIDSERDVEALGLPEIWSDPKNLVVIEWPEKIENILPQKRVNIHFEYLGDKKRKIVINDKWRMVNGK